MHYSSAALKLTPMIEIKNYMLNTDPRTWVYTQVRGSEGAQFASQQITQVRDYELLWRQTK